MPNFALSKTYNANAQTPDSAGTASALNTGVKTKAGVISVREGLKRGYCTDLGVPKNFTTANRDASTNLTETCAPSRPRFRRHLSHAQLAFLHNQTCQTASADG